MADKNFTKDIIIFYDKFLTNIAEVLENLAKIQEKHKKYYNELKEIQKDPTKLSKLTDELSTEQKGILFDLFIKAAEFDKRLIRLYDSTPKEKRQLAKDLKEFIHKLEKYNKGV